MNEQGTNQRTASISPAFLSGLSREIIVPLREVLADIDRLDSSHLKLRQRNLLWAAQSSALSACGVLESLADLPAIGATEPTIDRSVFPLEPTVDAVIASLVPLAADRGLRLHHQVETAVAGRVEGDRPRLRQLLTYLSGLVIRGAAGRDVTMRVMNQSVRDAGRVVIFQVNAPRVRDDLEAVTATTDRASWALYRQVARSMDGVIGVERDAAHGLTAYCTVGFTAPGTNCDERDQARRLRPALRCNLGRVEDLTLAGMRMSCRRRLRGQVRLKMEHGTNAVSCRAKVVWDRTLEDRTHEVGLRFAKLSPDELALIHRMSENGRG